MDLPLAIAIFALSTFFLVRSSGWVVNAVGRIAAFLELSEFVVAFVLMGFATSAPEVFVSVLAALRGDSIVAFGNNIGSNIFYPTILMGLAVLLARRIVVRSALLKRENVYATIIALLPFLFMMDFKLDRYEGIVLMALFFVYTVNLLRSKPILGRVYAHIENNTDENHAQALGKFFRNFLFLLGGVVVLVVSSDGVVRSALAIAQNLNLPLFIISAILIAAGVALPELAFSLRAAVLQKGEMILGNLFGSLVANSGLALGLAAVISPVVIEDQRFFKVTAFFAIMSLLIFGIFAWKNEELSWREGVILVMIYIVFVGVMLGLAPIPTV